MELFKGWSVRELGLGGVPEGVRTFTLGHQSCRRSPRYNAGIVSLPCHFGFLQGDKG